MTESEAAAVAANRDAVGSEERELNKHNLKKY